MRQTVKTLELEITLIARIEARVVKTSSKLAIIQARMQDLALQDRNNIARIKALALQQENIIAKEVAYCNPIAEKIKALRLVNGE